MDFICLEENLVVEVDGGQHNKQRDYDAKRDDYLRAQGFSVLRFWDHEVLTQINEVKEAIWNAVNRPPP